MFDLKSNFQSYLLNLGGAKWVWYLRMSFSFGMDLVVLAFDLTRRIGFEATAALETNFACKSSSPWPCLALRLWQRSTPKVVRLGGTFHLSDTTVLLSLWVSGFHYIEAKSCMSSFSVILSIIVYKKAC